MARPSKLTPELTAEMTKLIEAGNYLETAAAACGVDRETVRRWMKRGARQSKGPHAEFCGAIKGAEARAEARALVRIRMAGVKQWQAEAWYLERKFPQRWGRQSISVSGPIAAEIADKRLRRDDEDAPKPKPRRLTLTIVHDEEDD